MLSMRDDVRLYLRLMSFAKPYWPIVVVLVFSIVVGAAMEPLLPALMKPLVDENFVARGGEGLWVVPSLLVLVVFVRGLADYAVTYSGQYLATRTVEDLRQAIFAKGLDLSMEQDSAEEPGRKITRITYDTHMVSEAVSEAWMVLIRDSLVLVGLVGFLFYTSWQLACFVFLSLPILVVAIRRIGIRLRASSTAVQLKVARLTGFIQEVLLGLKEVKIFQASLQQEARFFSLNQSLRKEQMRAVRTSALAGPVVSSLTAVTVALVIYAASAMSAEGMLSPGEFVAFITALAMIFGPIRRLTSVNLVLQRGLAAAESIFGLLDRLGESGEVISPTSLVHRSGLPLEKAELNKDIRGQIEFQSVCFRYPGQATEVISDFSFNAGRGDIVAVVGPSGSGKSTLFSLISRFYRPDSGRILLDGIDIQHWGLHDLRSSLALVSQQVVLFDDSIANNIRIGRPQASDAEVIEAARAANVLEFIERMPNGFETEVGLLGDRLSGGQRQRISIARAFLKNAPILLLDEVTSALDKESERAVLSGLERLMKGKTVLLITHAPERLLGITKTIELTKICLA